MDLTILSVNCNPYDVLITFQGKRISSCEHDYHVLKIELQLVPKVNEDLDIGQFCLVQDKPFGSWHRGKILDKVKQRFEVVLIDQGNVVKVPFEQIASATGELFELPPKIVNGIFANVFPLDEKWSPRAKSFFSNLVGEQVNGHVKTFLPHQVILLEVSKVIDYAIELQVAKYMDSDTFCLLVDIINKFPANSHGKQMPDLLQQRKLTSDTPLSLNDDQPCFLKMLDCLSPKISVGTLEKIKISSAVSPERFYCHILSWKTELQKLTASMCSHYETDESNTHGHYGALCAAKRKDGLWYRCILLTVLSSRDVKVLFFDIGSSETILSSDLHQLKHKFLFLPMLAIPCALSRVNDFVESTRKMQLFLFKQALMGHIVIARIEEFCSDEKVFRISLYEKEYELNSDCHLTNQQVPPFYPNSCPNAVKTEYEEKSPDAALAEAFVSKKMSNEGVISYKCFQLGTGSVHVAYVEYVLNPSNFWIRTDHCQNEFVEMMAEIAERYNKCELMEMLIEDPQPGQLCCALYAKDSHYYRALITGVLNPDISVYFIDYGNTETVPFYDVKVLLPKFSTLPAMVMCCTLAYAYPHEDVWVKSANDAFKKIVAGKALLCHVLKKHRFKYVVEMRLSESSENSDIVSLLVQAGYAEFWKTDLNSSSVDQMCPLPEKGTKCKNKKSSSKHSVGECVTKGDIKVSLREWTMKTKSEAQTFSFSEASNNKSSNISPIYFKQYTFKPGAVRYVKCSHVGSPGLFWCQLSCNLTRLDTLMDEIQTFYKSSNGSYLHGQMACIARSSCTGKFFRASVVKHISKKEVDVIFVDYGRVERVLISELSEIKPQFLEWEGQAFRCCLSKALSSFSVHHTWSTSACQDFKSLVGSVDDIKCTVITVLGCGSEDLSNLVDLETSCGNANHWLASKGHLTFEGTVPPVHIHTFCYSSFDLEVGSKEYVYVSYIYNTGKFYCQLAQNEETVEALMSKVTALGERTSTETGKNVQGVCIAKYFEDGHFYRALVSPVDSDNFLAFFVDYGNSHMVKKADLLLIPEEATDVLFEPMQAIPCYLSGLKETTFTTEAKAWFEEQCFDTPLSALIVSRDNDGQLEMELFCGNTSVNSKIKEMLGVELKPPENAVNAKSSSTALPVGAKQHPLPELSKKSDSEVKDNKTTTSDLNGNVIPRLNSRLLLDSPQNSIPETLQKEPLHDTMQASKLPSLLHVGNSCSPPSLKEPLKSTDLPQMILETGSTHLVYASHICSPSEFYIHLATNEKQVLQLEEELNDTSLQPIDVNHLEKGTLVVAQYPEDKAFYRAEIKEILKSNSFEVEFIDYGNASKVDFPSIFKLPERFFNVPRLSISVLLTGAQKCQDGKWSKKAADMFSEQVTKEPFSCVFLCRHGSQWEVSITLEGKSVTEFLQSFETPPESSASVRKDTIPDVTLKPNQIEKVKTVYLSKSGTLFVTLASYAEDSKLGEQISAVVKQANNQLVAKDISEGMVCLVKSEKMQTWFRAAVEKIIPGTAEMSVFFVDHGAHEVVSMHSAKSLSAAALSLPRQSVPCTWIWMERVGIHFFRSQMQSILQKEVDILFLNFLQAESCWKVDILVNSAMLMEVFNTAPQPIAQDISNAVSSNFETVMLPSIIPRVQLKSLEVQAGFVTAFQNPFSFSVQLENSVVLMNKLSELTPKLTDDLLPLTAHMIRLGSACLVRCFGIDEWCRAEIASINMSSVSLNLLDYGVYTSIPYSDHSRLKVISKEMASLPALTYNCRLYGVLPKNGKDWSEDALKYCMDFIRDCDLLILPVKIIDNNVTEVSIYGKGNLAEKLISQGLAIVTSNNWWFPGAAAES
ncbi:PREDICTED: tudor domain-containing protein 15-like [Nanorana parkeri]|uniref:tudor domain-containing protein 15-like n=1 Tax=Nanorana parkeri TaxID=125878 RepID=UPI000854158D|nr:PREDICTED: tudor domain-containing protein 15-like [Nanorana parkeri]